MFDMNSDLAYLIEALIWMLASQEKLILRVLIEETVRICANGIERAVSQC